jgi:hypothetical protein
VGFLYWLASLGDCGRGCGDWLSRRSRECGLSCRSLRGDCGGVAETGSRCRGLCRRRFGGGRLVRGAGLLVASRRLNARGGRSLDSRWRRRNDYHRRPGHYCAGGRFGDHGARGRPGRNSGRCRRRDDNGRRGTRLGHNSARLGTGRRSHRRGYDGSRWRCGLRGRRRSRRRCARGNTRLPRLGFVFLLLGQDGLESVTGLGNLGEIDLGLKTLRGARRRGGGMAAGFGSTQLRANLLRLEILQRTGVGLAASQSQVRQYIQDLPALDFHLACEIVDSNLTHPPLFRLCCQSP